MLCLCHYGPALLRSWFQTNLKPENSASYLKIQAGKTFSYHGHALVKLYIQFLCSDLTGDRVQRKSILQLAIRASCS